MPERDPQNQKIPPQKNLARIPVYDGSPRRLFYSRPTGTARSSGGSLAIHFLWSFVRPMAASRRLAASSTLSLLRGGAGVVAASHGLASSSLSVASSSSASSPLVGLGSSSAVLNNLQFHRGIFGAPAWPQGWTKPPPNPLGGGEGGETSAEASAAVTSSSASTPTPADLVDALPPLDAVVDFGWWPHVQAAGYGIMAIHDTLGLPWYGSIAVAAFTLRILTFPVVVYQMRNTGRMAIAKPHVEEVNRRYGGQKAQASEEARQRYMEEVSKVWEKYQINPFSSFFVSMGLQLPMMTGFFFALNRLAEQSPDMATGGALWFQDLSHMDSTYMLPILTSAMFLTTVELNAAEGMAGQTGSGVKNGLRLLSVVMIPATAGFPAATLLHFFTSNMFGLLQGALFKFAPGTKKMLGIPSLADLPQRTSDIRKETRAASVGVPLHKVSTKPPQFKSAPSKGGKSSSKKKGRR